MIAPFAPPRTSRARRDATALRPVKPRVPEAPRPPNPASGAPRERVTPCDTSPSAAFSEFSIRCNARAVSSGRSIGNRWLPSSHSTRPRARRVASAAWRTSRERVPARKPSGTGAPRAAGRAYAAASGRSGIRPADRTRASARRRRRPAESRSRCSRPASVRPSGRTPASRKCRQTSSRLTQCVRRLRVAAAGDSRSSAPPTGSRAMRRRASPR